MKTANPDSEKLVKIRINTKKGQIIFNGKGILMIAHCILRISTSMR